MPIPGSILGNILPNGIAAAAIMYPSLATLRPITKTVATTGQERHTFADSSDPTQQNLGCRRSPLIQIRPQHQETETGDVQRLRNFYQLNFESYIAVAPDVLVQWQVKVDGVIYQIIAVEGDGMNITTRLMISLETPLNP